MLRPPSRGLVSHCLPLSSHICVPVLDGVSACLPLFPFLSPILWHTWACVGRCVHLPEVSSPHCLPIYIPPLIPHRVPMPPIAFIVPHCSHCLPTCVPVDGGLAFLRRACVGWCVHIPELLSRLVSQLVSHVSPCVPVADDAPAFPKSCPALCPCVGCCLRVPPLLDGVSAFLKPCLPSYLPSEVLSSLVPPFFPLSSRMCAPHVCLCCVTAFPRSCLPLSLFFSTCVPVLDGASAFPRSCLRLSPIVSPFVCLCLDGMTHCLPLSSLHMCLRWISEVLPPLVSHCLPTSAPVLDGVSAFLKSSLSHSLPSCVPLLDGMPAFPSCLPLFPYVSHCLQLSVIVSPHVSPPSRGLVSPCVPSCFPRLDGASAVPLLWIISHCLPFCFPFFDGVPSRGLVPQLVSQLVSQLARLSFLLVPFGVCLPACFLVSQLVSQLVFVLVSLCWVVCPSSPCLPRLPSFFPLLDGLSAFPSPCPFVSQLVYQFVFLLVSLCWRVRPPSYGLVSFVSQLVFQLVSQLAPQLVSQLVSQVVSPLFPSKNFSHAENCADLKVHRAPGLKMMCHLSLSSFDVFNTSNLTVLCCLLRAFGTKYLHPHRMLPSSFFGI